MEINKPSTFFVMTEKNTAKAAGNYEQEINFRNIID